MCLHIFFLKFRLFAILNVRKTRHTHISSSHSTEPVPSLSITKIDRLCHTSNKRTTKARNCWPCVFRLDNFFYLAYRYSKNANFWRAQHFCFSEYQEKKTLANVTIEFPETLTRQISLPESLPWEGGISLELQEGFPILRASPAVQYEIEELLHKQTRGNAFGTGAARSGQLWRDWWLPEPSQSCDP